MKDEILETLTSQLRGDVIRPDDPGYPEACKLYNGMIDKRPALIARDARWSMVIAAVDPDPAKASDLKDWARGYWQAVRPHAREGGYVNFMMGEEDAGRITAAYGPNHARLARIKARYDPENLFRINQNIAPAPAVHQMASG